MTVLTNLMLSSNRKGNDEHNRNNERSSNVRNRT